MSARNTVQRTIVLDALRSLANHPTADEVFDVVHAEHPSISKATVYRLLNKLSEDGDALKVKINNGADHFDHQTFSHYHIRCRECGRVEDVLIPVLATVDCDAAKLSGYQNISHTLQFDGVCPACQGAAAGACAPPAQNAE